MRKPKIKITLVDRIGKCGCHRGHKIGDNVKRIEGKNGVTFKITVTQGRDMHGKQVRHYKTWTPAPGMTERQMQKAVQKAAIEFEQSIELGYQLDNRQTFAEYAEYVMDLKEREGKKYRTLEIYGLLLERVNQAIGNMKLADIRPQHLNAFYKNLTERGIREAENRAVAKVDIPAMLKEKGLSRAAVARQAGISETTVGLACNCEKVLESRAQKFADVLEMDYRKLFQPVTAVKKPLSNTTINKYHGLIHTILAQAEREMLIPYNPASKATPPKINREEVQAFQPEEIDMIRDAAEQEPIKWKTLVHMFLITGARRGEICGIKWEKIDFEQCSVKIDQSLLYSPKRGVYESTTKTGATRIIRLPKETMQLLRQYRAWQNSMRLACGDRWTDNGYLFTTDEGKPLNPATVSTYMKHFQEKYSLPHINPHKFRHTMASILYFSGADPVSISKRLGHADVSTTQNIYSHLIEKADMQSAEMIADAFLRKQKQA